MSAPVGPTANVIAVGLNYLDHVEECQVAVPTKPYLFPKMRSAVTGPYADIVHPHQLTKQMDYEVELAIFVGSRLHNATASEAGAAIAGYAVSNDLSAREWQVPDPWPNWVRAKGLDGFLPIGPYMTTADEIEDVGSLQLETRVNETVRQSSSTRHMIFPVNNLIAYISQAHTIEAGDVIITGTPAGGAFARPDHPWLAPGDVVSCTIAGLGIKNRIV